jgi:hypothetical protein
MIQRAAGRGKGILAGINTVGLGRRVLGTAAAEEKRILLFLELMCLERAADREKGAEKVPDGRNGLGRGRVEVDVPAAKESSKPDSKRQL